jgi:DNA-binding XRE family transcriptional regulator
MGRRIAQLRESAHMTQEGAADKAGVTLRAYQKWEAETPDPFRLSDQIADVDAAFRQDVDQIKERLTAIEAELLAATSERKRIEIAIAQMAANVASQATALESQTEILEGFKTVIDEIRNLVSILQNVNHVERAAETAARHVLGEIPLGPAARAQLRAQAEKQSKQATGRLVCTSPYCPGVTTR